MASVSIGRIGSPLSLAAMGGTFIEHRPGRKITSLPITEDEADELLFLNRNDYRSDYVPFEEFGDWESIYYHDDEDERSFAQRLLAVSNLTSDQISAAAGVVLDNPELLIELYAKGIDPEGIRDEGDWWEARKKIVGLTQNVFTIMLTLAPTNVITRSLQLRRDESGKTLLSHLAQFAREELKDKKSRHFTACIILKALGYDDVFSRNLD